jgi:hypothetical protein
MTPTAIRPRLTRLLYLADEARLALTTALLTSAPAEECIYWIAEFHASGWTPFEMLWDIYYDFYSIKNPNMFDFIRRKEQLYESGASTDSLLAVVKNMRVAQWDISVFALRQLLDDRVCPQHVFTGRPPAVVSELSSLPAPVRKFAIAWVKGNWVDICAYLAPVTRTDVTPIDIGEVLSCLCRAKAPTAFIRANNWNSVLAYMVQLRFPLSERRPAVRILPSPADRAIWDEVVAPLAPELHDVKRYDIMRCRVSYGPAAGHLHSFHLARHVVPPEQDVHHLWASYASFYARDTPYWHERLTVSGFLPPRPLVGWDASHLVFQDDDSDELFHDEYWVHPDEQPEKVRELCVPFEIDEMDDGRTTPAGRWLGDVLTSKYWSEGDISVPTLMGWIGSNRLHMYQN